MLPLLRTHGCRPGRDQVERDTRIEIRTSLDDLIREPGIRTQSIHLIARTGHERRKMRTRTNIHRRVRILREQMQVGQELSERDET